MNDDDIYRATVKAMDRFQIDTGLPLSVAQTNVLHAAIADALREARSRVKALEGALTLIATQNEAQTGEWKAGVEFMQETARALLPAQAESKCEHESFDVGTGCCAICGFNFAPTPSAGAKEGI